MLLKRILQAVLVLLVLAAVLALGAALAQAAETGTKHTPYTSFAAKAATGAGTEYSFNPSVEAYTWQVTFTGVPTAATVDLEGAVDGVNFYPVDTNNITTDYMRHVVNKPVRALRCRVTAWNAGAGVNATCKIMAAR